MASGVPDCQRSWPGWTDAAQTAWQALADQAEAQRGLELRRLFADDAQRAQRFTLQACGLRVDYSKQRITPRTLELLLELARQRGVASRARAMASGQVVNHSEQHPALHMALRAPRGQQIHVDGMDVVPQVHAALDRMRAFCRQLRGGQWLGATGRRIRHVVNIGIGGSDLGPVVAHQALRPYRQPGLEVRFVSNLDGADLLRVTRGLDAAETLFIVCSKSFRTLDTLVNARAARQWCLGQLGSEDAIAHHFVAVSANEEEVRKFGIAPQATFPMWDWVGGRYSMESAVGLSTMLAVGEQHFDDLLAGFRAMDEHFLGASAAVNLPLILGLLAIWNNNFLGAGTQAVLPYARNLQRFPAYLQQLAMESNGKSVTETGQPVAAHTGPIYWGEPGTNGQHSFYQLLHQGTRLVPCDLIGFLEPVDAPTDQHELLLANLIAQGEALAFGRDADTLRAQGADEALIPHRICPGNRPSTTILARRLDPFTLGTLVALYEHSVFVQGSIWGIDSFDQWGVELGKHLATRVAADLASAQEVSGHDSSTNALINHYRNSRGRREP